MEILFYFKDPRFSESSIDANQLLEVENFKKKIQGNSVYRDFTSTDQFRTLLLAHLSDAIESLRKNTGYKSDVQIRLNEQSVSNGVGLGAQGFEDDWGLFELTHQVEESMDSVSEKFSDLTFAIKLLGEKLGNRTREFESLKSTDQKVDRNDSKRILLRIAADILSYSGTVDRLMPDIERDFIGAISAMQKSVIISDEDGFSDDDERDELVLVLREMRETLLEVSLQVTDFKESIDSVPRLIAKTNQAKRAASRSTNRMVNFLDDSVTNIETVLEALTGPNGQ